MGQPVKSEYPGSERVILPFKKRYGQVEESKFGYSSHELATPKDEKKSSKNQQSFEYNEKNSLLENHKEIIEQIAGIREALNSAMEAAYQYKENEGGEGVDKDKVMEKLNDLDKKVGILEERTKKLEVIPTKDEMKLVISQALQENLKDLPKINDVKVIIEEAVREKGLAKKDDVDRVVEKAKNTIIITTFGFVTTVAGLLFTAIKFWGK